MLFSVLIWGCAPGVCAEGRDFIKPRHALHRHRHSWCYGDAPQPYLHSSIVQTRDWGLPRRKVGSDYVYTIDSTVAFRLHCSSTQPFSSCRPQHFIFPAIPRWLRFKMRTNFFPLLGVSAAVLFCLALLASGQSSTLTATLAGQNCDGGFCSCAASWLRRLIKTHRHCSCPDHYLWREVQGTCLSSARWS